MGKQLPKLAKWASNIQPSSMQDALALGTGERMIKFGLGLPDPSLFPNDRLADIMHAISKNAEAFQYSPPLTPLKTYIKKLMAKRGVECTEEQIFITNGAQQGISLLARLLLNHAGCVFTEEAIYPGFKQVLEPFEPEIMAIPTDFREGIDLTYLRHLLEKSIRPSLLYTVTDGHNPLGVSLGLDKRKELADLAAEYEFPIIEDDPYGFLNYEEEDLPPLRSFNEDWILYVGSFSKILTPSLRVGWIVAPERFIDKLSIVKEANDINTATLSHHVVASYLQTGELDQHISYLCDQYKLKRDVMLTAIDDTFSNQVMYCTPSHGMFTWVTFLDEINTNEALVQAIQKEQVSFIPGSAFSWSGNEFQSSIRLNFSFNSTDVIQEGIHRLKRIFLR